MQSEEPGFEFWMHSIVTHAMVNECYLEKKTKEPLHWKEVKLVFWIHSVSTLKRLSEPSLKVDSVRLETALQSYSRETQLNASLRDLLELDHIF